MLRQAFAFSRGIFALFFRSLRTESRSLRMHMLWLLFMVVIYVTLWFVREMTATFGAPGLFFFRCIIYADAVFITLLGVSFFSSVISEEKEEDTLGLMTMAGISPLGILVGKSTSRLFQVALLLAIQYPFTLLAITMGGLLPTQIYSAYTALLAYTILIANVGLLCSVACRTNRNAAGLATLWLLGYLAVTPFAYAGTSYLVTERGWSRTDPGRGIVLQCLDWISANNIYVELNEATITGYEFTWTPQIIGNSLGGVICFLLAWGLFGFVAKEPAQETASRGMVARGTTRGLRVFSAGRAWGLPFVWKDFFFTAGGWAGLLIRCLLYSGLYFLCYCANRPWYDNANYSIRWDDVTQGFQVFAHPLLAIDIALCVSRVFHDEIRGQTLSSILMLPQSVPALVYSKLVGCGLAVLPGVAAIWMSFFMTGGMRFIGDATNESAFWWWLTNLLLLIHLTGLFSTFLRTGAFVLALGTVIGTMIMTVFFIEMISIGTGRGVIEAFFVLFALGHVMICIGCHVIVLLRLPILGTR